MTLRTVRSFVRRAGRMTSSQEDGLNRLWPRYGIEVGELIDSQAIFGKSGPLVLDIGFGMGEGLLEQAKQAPDTHFIGVEVHEPGIGRLLNEIEKASLSNLRVMKGDVKDIIEKSVGNQIVDKLQLFFPDPWPKKKHHKRRLVQPDFVNLFIPALKPGAMVHFATDWEDYYHHMVLVMKGFPAFHVATQEAAEQVASERPPSRFMQRGLRLGHTLYDLVYVFEPKCLDDEALYLVD